MCSKLRDKTVSKDSRLTSNPKSRFEQWTNITLYVGKRKTKILSVNCRRSHLILTGSTQDKPRSKHKRQRSYKITKTEATSFPLYRQVAKLSMATSMRTCVPTAAQFIAEKIWLGTKWFRRAIFFKYPCDIVSAIFVLSTCCNAVFNPKRTSLSFQVASTVVPWFRASTFKACRS